ncbi:MAG: alanine dehydrogenase [Tissierellia bacterium]|nr:alanine dehydrogenase [Tissierellia bacterium]
MRIGVPKEIKDNEQRVALTPAGAAELIKFGHEVFVETKAGVGSDFTDEDYVGVGAKIVTAEEAWNNAEMIIKVKEPLESEYKYFRENLILFTYLHLAAEEKLTKALVDKKVVSIAYETVQLPDRSLPLLTPMSEVAGRMALQEGCTFLEKIHGGKGLLLDGVPGVAPAHVVIVGAGVAGAAALKRAVGGGARVTILDVALDRLKYLGEIYGSQIETVYSNSFNLMEAMKTADLVISTVLIPGEKAPKLVTEEMVKAMPDGGVIVDVAIDQGGTTETQTTPTSHTNPVELKHGILHYAVPNIPGAVPKTSTLALTNVTLRYAVNIANKGWKDAVLADAALAKGVNVVNGHVTFEGVAKALDMPYVKLEDAI